MKFRFERALAAVVAVEVRGHEDPRAAVLVRALLAQALHLHSACSSFWFARHFGQGQPLALCSCPISAFVLRSTAVFGQYRPAMHALLAETSDARARLTAIKQSLNTVNKP